MTPFSNKTNILAEFYVGYGNAAEWKPFFYTQSIGLSISYLTTIGLVKPKADAAAYVNETWEELCKALGADPKGTYKHLEDMIDV